MHPDEDQDGTSATEFTPDSELFTVLSAEAARVAGEEAQFRTGAADISQGKTDTFFRKRREEEETCTAPLPRRVVFLEQNRPAATTVLCFAVTLNVFLTC